MEDQETTNHRLAQLESEHRDLDDVIDQIIGGSSFDQIQVQRLKKRKLILKDEILRLRSILIPDSIA
ncbi:MAG: YdcH family protein [Proteobacteria bacterium]|nr:YdcH family protein [Pseudomonadota bacterium]